MSAAVWGQIFSPERKMGGAKRQREEYEEFLVDRPPVHMNTDTLAYILTMALEATQLELEKVRKELEELRSRQERRRISTGTGTFTDLNERIARSQERIYRIVATTLN